MRGVKTVTEIAQEYGVHPVLVGQWKKEILENAGVLFDFKRGSKPVDESSPEGNNDPPPGNTVMWRGMRRLTDMQSGFNLGSERYG